MPQLKERHHVSEAGAWKVASRYGVHRPTRVTESKRALILSLKGQPGLSQRGAAAIAECSQRTVNRVWAEG